MTAVTGEKSTTQVMVSGEASRVPLLEMATTVNVCWPASRTGVVNGEVHGASGASSRLHSKVPPEGTAWKVITAVVSGVDPCGPSSMKVSGATSTTVHD